jgi:hypothetical protein
VDFRSWITWWLRNSSWQVWKRTKWTVNCNISFWLVVNYFIHKGPNRKGGWLLIDQHKKSTQYTCLPDGMNNHFVHCTLCCWHDSQKYNRLKLEWTNFLQHLTKGYLPYHMLRAWLSYLTCKLFYTNQYTELTIWTLISQ